MPKFPRLALLAALLMTTSAYAADGAPVARSGLIKTFDDEFDRFSWFAEGDTPTKGGGTWRTNFGAKWCPVDDIKNHSLIWNHEKEVYVDPGFRGSSPQSLNLNPFSVSGGVLHITANRTDNPALGGYQFTSGLISSEPSFAQTYGLFEMRARLPAGRGYWPAFWLMPADKSWPPEIDIMEILGHEPGKLYTTLHTKETGKHTKSDIPPHDIPDSSADYHTYALDWGPQEMVFYFDDKEIARRPTPADMNKPFYILINLAVGGDWPGNPDAATPLPGTMDVDWVRVWQRPDYIAASSKPSGIVAR